MKTVCRAISDSARDRPTRHSPRDPHPQTDRRDEIDDGKMHGRQLPGGRHRLEHAAAALTTPEDHGPVAQAERASGAPASTRSIEIEELRDAALARRGRVRSLMLIAIAGRPLQGTGIHRCPS